MDQAAQAPGDPDAMHQRVRGTNICEKTLLATDYLNHFNEIIMIFDFCDQMPEFVDEARVWRLKSYEEHFRMSGLSYGELAAEAYQHAPPRFRKPFDATIEMITLVVRRTIAQIVEQVDGGDLSGTRSVIQSAAPVLKRLSEIAGNIINGNDAALKDSQMERAISLVESAR
jgi:hypothetical protein